MKCLKPIVIQNPNVERRADFQYQYIKVPCGKCINCLSNRRSSWVLRNRYQNLNSISSIFVTLTYDDSHLHFITSDFATLFYRDLQLFFKRLRKVYGRGIKYYSCGEYGSHTFRPHYHAIIYNLPLLENGKDFYEFYQSKIKNLWSLGNVSCSKVTDARIGYITKYIIKTDEDKRIYREFGLESPQLRASKGIGSGLYAQIDLQCKSIRYFGQSYQIPRYVLEKLRNSDEVLFRKIQKSRAAFVENQYSVELDRQLRRGYPSTQRLYSDRVSENERAKYLIKRSKNQQL